MTELTNNRWIAADDEFAVRLEVADVSGFFSKTITIEPGVRALFLERGQSVGEVPPGQYSLQVLTDRMKFWTRKSATVILTKETEVPLDLHFAGLSTSELIEVEVAIRLSVQISDVALFQKNLLGSKSQLTIDDLRKIVEPIIRQALWETASRFSIKDLTGEQARGDLEICVSQALGTTLVRNGLKFAAVQTLSVSHPEYDAHRRRTGQLWLQRLDVDHDQAAAKQTAEKLYAEIQQQEKTDELEVLAQQVAADRMEGDLSVRIRRIGIRKSIREAIQSDQFNRINSDEEFAKFVQQRDQERLIRQDEFDTLATTLQEGSTDRATTRAHLLRRLEIEQQTELQALKIDLDFAQRTKTRKYEISLAELNDSEESRKWKAELEREFETARKYRDEALKQLEHERLIAQTGTADQREEDWQGVLHSQRLDRVQGEIKLTQAERQQRVTLVEVEIHKTREYAELDIKRRKAELEREINSGIDGDQFERLRKVQELNLAMMKAQQEMKQSESRQQVELEIMKEDRAAQRSLDRIKEMKGMNALGLLATSENASIIADVLKHKSTQKATIKMAEAQAFSAQVTNAKQEELQQKLTDAERRSSDRIVEEMRAAMLAMQSNFSQMTSMADNITRNLAPQPSSTVVVSGGTAVPVTGPGATHDNSGRKVLICQSCRTENHDNDRHCRQCGKPL